MITVYFPIGWYAPALWADHRGYAGTWHGNRSLGWSLSVVTVWEGLDKLKDDSIPSFEGYRP